VAHQPEIPERYVRLDCNAVYVGRVTETDGSHHYEPPEARAACSSSSFVPIEESPRVDADSRESGPPQF